AVHESRFRPARGRRRPLVNLPATSWLSAGLVFVTVVLGSVGMALLLQVVQEGRRRRQVVKQLQTLGALDAAEAETSGGLLRRPIAQQPAWVRALSARMPSIRDLGILLQQSGSSIGVGSFLLLCIGLGFGLGAGVLIVTRLPIIAGVAAAFGVYLP